MLVTFGQTQTRTLTLSKKLSGSSSNGLLSVVFFNEINK